MASLLGRRSDNIDEDNASDGARSCSLSIGPVINSQVLFLIYWSLIKRTYTFYKITKTLGEEKQNKCSDKTNLPWMTGVVIVEP
jgi:hypothetical protein